MGKQSLITLFGVAAAESLAPRISRLSSLFSGHSFVRPAPRAFFRPDRWI
jgi:hypothetical protein